MPDWSDIISTAEAGEILECTSDQVARLCRTGRLDSHRLLQRKAGAAVWLTTRTAVVAYRQGRRDHWAWVGSGWEKKTKTSPAPWS